VGGESDVVDRAKWTKSVTYVTNNIALFSRLINCYQAVSGPPLPLTRQDRKHIVTPVGEMYTTL
jgi:hypothetical protein